MWKIARRNARAGLVALLLAFAPAAGAAQDASQQEISDEQLAAYTKAFAEVGQARDEVQAKLAASPNKTAEAQAQLREGLKEKAAEIIRANGLTPAQYTRITWRVSVDNELRQSFEEILARLMAAKSSGP
jgi:septal ring factor EnvC (AmiA/AmiB activator)